MELFKFFIFILLKRSYEFLIDNTSLDQNKIYFQKDFIDLGLQYTD